MDPRSPLTAILMLGGVVVSTVAGNGTRQCVDGKGAAALICLPWSLARESDGKSLLVTEFDSDRVRRFSLETRMNPGHSSALIPFD